MFKAPFYALADVKDWVGKPHTESTPQYLYEIIRPLDLNNLPSTPLKGSALLGFSVDEGVKRNHGRLGAKFAPKKIKQTLAKLALHTSSNVYDAGFINIVNDNLLQAQNNLGKAVSTLLNLGLFPIILGGGHETAFGHYLGLQSYLKNHSLSIINIDAHFDLRKVPSDNIGTSGTIFKQIADLRLQNSLTFDYYCLGIQKSANSKKLFHTALELNSYFLLAEDIHQNPTLMTDFVDKIVAKNDPIYLSLCLDVFASVYAPGVSAPQPLGLTPYQVIPSLQRLIKSNLLLSLDVVELNPNYDVDEITTKLASQMINLFL